MSTTPHAAGPFPLLAADVSGEPCDLSCTGITKH